MEALNTKPRERENWIDWGKAIAIYAVVLGHVTTSECSTWVQSISTWGCQFHVALFFLISGYLFRIKEGGLKTLLKNDVKTLIIPYIFFNLISAPILFKLQSHEVWMKGLHDFFTGEGFAFSGPSWFLVALFIVRILAYFLETKFCLICKWAIINLLMIISSFNPIFLPFGLSSAFTAIFFFEIGMILNRKGYIKRIGNLNKFVLYSLPIILIIAQYYTRPLGYINFANGSMTIPFLPYINVMLAVSMAVSICICLNKTKSIFIKELAKDSIVIMGLHLLFVQIFWAYSNKLPESIQIIFDTPINSITSTLFCVITAIIIRKYVSFLIGNRR